MLNFPATIGGEHQFGPEIFPAENYRETNTSEKCKSSGSPAALTGSTYLPPHYRTLQ